MIIRMYKILMVDDDSLILEDNKTYFSAMGYEVVCAGTAEEAEKIMAERFGKDTVIALATVENQVPYVRYVNAYYENGAFYVITYALSSKMKHMESNPVIAIAGEWFTAHGRGINLGYFGKEENHKIAERLKKVFSEWIDNGHNNFDDENTVILCVELTDGLLLSHGTRYEF